MFVGSDRYGVICTEVLSPNRVKVYTVYEPDFFKNVEETNEGMFVSEEMLNKIKKDNEFNVEQFKEECMAITHKLPNDAEILEEEECHYNKFYKEYSLRKNGRWMEKGKPADYPCLAIGWGFARPYIDPGF